MLLVLKLQELLLKMLKKKLKKKLKRVLKEEMLLLKVLKLQLLSKS